MQGIDMVWLFLAIILVVLPATVFFTVSPTNMICVVVFWVASWVSQTFAPHLAAISLVLVGLAAYSMEPAGVQSVTVLLLLVSVGLFVRTYFLGLKTQLVIDDVVDVAIDRLGENPVVINPSEKKRGCLPIGLRPFHYKNSQVKCIKNIAYGDQGKSHLCDIYLPTVKQSKPMPILIQIPGGAWISGSKDQQGLPLLNHMAAQGWACFTANYRLGPKTRFPGMLTDLLQFIAWVKDHAEEYGADPSFIAITGGSAGGHLISLAALIQDKTLLQPGFETADTSVSVVAPIYGRYDFLNQHQLIPKKGLEPFLTAKVMPGSPEDCYPLWELASPENQVHAQAPPFLIVHGSADTLIPAKEAQAFVKALSRVSTQAVDYAELPKAQHAFDVCSTTWAQPTVNALGRYFNAHYQHHLKNKAQ